MTTPRSVADEVRTFLSALADSEIAEYVNDVSELPTMVSWNTPTKSYEGFLHSRNQLTLGGYLHWLETNQYSAVLRDGSLLQISYDFDGHAIAGHRLAWVPCPVTLDIDSVALFRSGEPLADVVRMRASETDLIGMRSAVRFDYDPRAAGEDHPAVHVTLNTSDCRIACVAPLRVGRFVDFVFRNFYPKEFREFSFLRSMPLDGWSKRDFDDETRGRLHLNWG